jgi:hypothetical protein
MRQLELSPNYRSVVAAEGEDVMALLHEDQLGAGDLLRCLRGVVARNNRIVGAVGDERGCGNDGKGKGIPASLIGLVVGPPLLPILPEIGALSSQKFQ